ncbi:uncharacterized protein LOC121382534 isoform X2 [Gigantopelta aegis]|uniref:uncharacterized protein LOC121382534 isoform X2 n=1 Tax=Gigantopelta aegis TaxID=1735272 RepID=UPI001B8895C1|nr:uncharacterized protein LOC121382534 isoform X2 [Gigantopelta aegis]
MDFINVHPVQMHQLEGLWTVKLGQPSNLQKVVHFTTSKDGSLVYLSVQYNSTSEMCHPVEYLKLQETSNGNFKGIKHGWPLYFKVLYSDGTELVTYICFQTKNDGTCNNTMVHLEILSNADVISDAKIMMLRKSATSVCMNDSMPIQTSIAPCVISIAMIEAATNGDIGADYVQVSCMHQFIPVQKDFDPDKFAGVWNNVKNIGGYDAISRTSYFAAHAHGILTEVYSIHDATNQNCSLPELVTHKQLGQPGEYTFTLNKTTGLMKILYTDYLTAVVYTCLEEAHDGTCKEDHAIIAVMARGSEISNSRMVELASFFKIGCVNIADAHISNGSCIITSHILEATNMKDIIEAVSKARPSTQCVLDKVVTVANFELIQMSGHWYELARTRYTFNRMESVVIYYNYNHSIHMLNGVYTGSMDGECQLPPITSLTKIDPSEKQVGVMGRIGGMTSSYPWVSFKILFFDGRFLMFYVCYENQTDGSCKQDQMEVTLLGRTPEKSKLIESLLPKLMSDVCLSQADLINTKREADCNSALFALPVHSRSRTFEIDPMKKCSSLADINVPGNFKEIEILGHWVGAAFLDLNTPERGRYGLTITVSRNTPTSLKMVINWRNEPQQTVILKQRCRGYGDYISTYSSSTMQQWSKVKILKTNANDVLVYWCTKELDGFCLASGARVDVLTRSSIYNKEELNALTGSIGDDCFPSARFLKPIDTEEYYSKFIAEASLVSGESVLSASPCTVDNIPTINIDTDRVI